MPENKDMIDNTKETKDDVFRDLLEHYDAEVVGRQMLKEARGLTLGRNLKIASSQAAIFAKRYENAE